MGFGPSLIGEIGVSLQRSPEAGGERRVYVAEDGQQALTRFQLIRNTSSSIAWFWRNPGQGRTHQIRVHAQFAGFPLCG